MIISLIDFTLKALIVGAIAFVALCLITQYAIEASKDLAKDLVNGIYDTEEGDSE